MCKNWPRNQRRFPDCKSDTTLMSSLQRTFQQHNQCIPRPHHSRPSQLNRTRTRLNRCAHRWQNKFQQRRRHMWLSCFPRRMSSTGQEHTKRKSHRPLKSTCRLSKRCNSTSQGLSRFLHGTQYRGLLTKLPAKLETFLLRTPGRMTPRYLTSICLLCRNGKGRSRKSPRR